MQWIGSRGETTIEHEHEPIDPGTGTSTSTDLPEATGAVGPTTEALPAALQADGVHADGPQADGPQSAAEVDAASAAALRIAAEVDALLATADTLVAAFLAVDSQGRLAGPQARVPAAQQAMVAATATSLARREELSEERQNNFSGWLAWPDGRTLSRWLPRADLLVQAIDGRDAALAGAWQADLHAMIATGDREKFDSGFHVTPTWPHLRSAAVRRTGIVLMVASPAIWIVMALILIATKGAVSVHPAIPIAVVGLGLVLLVAGAVMSDPAWQRQNAAAGAAASARRVELLGFDPLAEPDRRPRSWMDSPSPRNRLDRFLRDVYTNFPSADELPELVLPAVRDPADEPSPLVRAALEHFSAVDSARDSGLAPRAPVRLPVPLRAANASIPPGTRGTGRLPRPGRTTPER